MIPSRLQLRNFMSYGDPGAEVRFDFRTACLSGNNGEGKSALLDAMTWALWGKARSDRLAADDVVRLAPGVEEATVSFEFRIGDALYRVTRKRHLRRGSALELLVRDGGEFRPLTSHTQRDTQAMLNALLLMDYDTFLNSAFLAQGRADEFTRQTPAERKRLLGEILGLSQYDRLEARARQNSREAASRGEHEKRECQRIELQIREEPNSREELERLTASLAAAEEAARAAESDLDGARKLLSALEQAAGRLKSVEAAIERMNRDERSLARQMQSFRERIQAHDRIIGRSPEIAAGLAGYEQARVRLAEMERKQAAAAGMEKQKGEALHAIELEGQQLRGEAQALERRISELKAVVDGARQIATQAEEVRRQVDSLDGMRRQSDEAARQVADVKASLAVLNEQNQRLAAEKEALSQKLRMLKQAQARCPVCRQALPEEDRARLLEDMEAQELELHRQAQENSRNRRQAASALTDLDRRLRRMQAEVKPLPSLQRQLGELERRLQEAQQAGAQMADLEEKCGRIAQRLQKNEFAQQQRAALEDLNRQLASLGYDAEEHRAARESAAKLERFAQQALALEQARKALPEDRAALEQMRASHQSVRQAVFEAEKEREELREQAGRLPQARERAESLQKKVQEAQAERTSLAGKAAACREKLERFRALREELAQRRKDLRQAEDDAVIWSELAAAFSRDGIQALVIENVVPQMEDDANDLLARLTDERMHLSFHTEKPVKSRGTTAETLDIHISDELGERKYESYSGGEAFRINFAIRVALARLLAQRAGAKLQTLVIDEGFGTQDADARDKLIQAIRTIEPDFEKILVVTHMEEMKESFPHRIIVTKDENGSHVEQVAA